MFERTDKAVSEYKKELAKMQAELREKFIEDLKLDAAELKAAFPNLDKIFIIGSTPEWNDGEECVHESEVLIENRNGDGWYDMRTYVDRMYWDAEVVPDEFLHINMNLSPEDLSKIRLILLNAGLEDDLEAVFETNYHIIIDMTGEDVEVIVEDYDRGY
ncbi:hypothetical protein GAP32_157 [Cronobacter phage vB_CsaM_GAP32]|uniref:Uncharacterized protein n=1 Tax=Cronobacter phage vB_CsaM_GAP32 TaxID=1141136 RepID=K4F7C2_9CAUD|nr:hypothetical protein GAP32_157 [Cronobacter phage vB_CsaM_GAP32]AFC21607.1 hypothetical protein GAP32_157 [Cronobacter phage vB_CsaM_GAP32]